MKHIKEIVYLLGAGFNKNFYFRNDSIPPLINDFFKINLKSLKIKENQDKYRALFGFIKKEFNKSISDLKHISFNIEELFTSLDSKESEQRDQLDKLNLTDNQYDYVFKNWKKYSSLNFQTKSIFADFLERLVIDHAKGSISEFFARKIYEEKPAILTFNYDCILENLIYDHAHKMKKEYILGYGIEFNKTNLYDKPHDSQTVEEFKRKTELYEFLSNSSTQCKLIKLHGSVNWFRPLYLRKDSPNVEVKSPYSKQRIDQVILSYDKFWEQGKPDIDGEILNPLMITPIRYKDKYIHERPFNELWKLARDYLNECKRLIIIGYSFPDTDTSIRKLIHNTFAQKQLEQLIIINPDRNAIAKAKNLIIQKKEVKIYENLKEFLI